LAAFIGGLFHRGWDDAIDRTKKLRGEKISEGDCPYRKQGRDSSSTLEGGGNGPYLWKRERSEGSRSL